jgi:hypothetical protein
MNKKITLPIVFALIIVAGILYYIFSNKVEVDKEGGVTTKKDALVIQEVSYEKDGTVFKFTKNRMNRTAIVNMRYALSDTDEFGDFMGSKVTMAPFMINYLCSVINQAFYEPQALQNDTKDASQAAKLTDDSEFKNALGGYTVSEFKIDFVDKESSEAIASCQSARKGFENIKFTAVRDYSKYDSFFGQKIGVAEKDENAK